MSTVCIDFNFHEMIGVGESRDLDHGRRGPYGVEELTVRATDLVLVADVGDEHPSPDDVLDGEPRLSHRIEGNAERRHGLQVRVTGTDDLSPDVAVVPATNSAGPATTARE